ncbi:MAG: Rho termination factor N-terminal domain-containing protein [Thermoleophilia bacterium]
MTRDELELMKLPELRDIAASLGVEENIDWRRRAQLIDAILYTTTHPDPLVQDTVPEPEAIPTVGAVPQPLTTITRMDNIAALRSRRRRPMIHGTPTVGGDPRGE